MEETNVGLWGVWDSRRFCWHAFGFLGLMGENLDAGLEDDRSFIV